MNKYQHLKQFVDSVSAYLRYFYLYQQPDFEIPRRQQNANMLVGLVAFLYGLWSLGDFLIGGSIFMIAGSYFFMGGLRNACPLKKLVAFTQSRSQDPGSTV